MSDAQAIAHLIETMVSNSKDERQLMANMQSRFLDELGRIINRLDERIDRLSEKVDRLEEKINNS